MGDGFEPGDHGIHFLDGEGLGLLDDLFIIAQHGAEGLDILPDLAVDLLFLIDDLGELVIGVGGLVEGLAEALFPVADGGGGRAGGKQGDQEQHSERSGDFFHDSFSLSE